MTQRTTHFAESGVPSLKHWAKRTYATAFGVNAYCNSLALAYRLFSRRAHRHSVRFAEQEGVVAAFDRKSVFYFCVPERASRYIWDDGPLVMSERIWSKYVDEDLALAPADVVVDVGANVGEFSVAALRRGFELHAFEPDTRAFAALTRNCSEDARAVLNCVGLGRRSEQRTFYISTDDADSSFFPPPSYNAAIELPTIPLDAYVEARKIDRIGLLKIEAEGFEPEVLAGATKTLRKTRFVSIDCSPERGGADTVSECQRALDEAGFRIRLNRWILRGTRG